MGKISFLGFEVVLGLFLLVFILIFKFDLCDKLSYNFVCKKGNG
jgi:hypothetical protein